MTVLPAVDLAFSGQIWPQSPVGVEENKYLEVLPGPVLHQFLGAPNPKTNPSLPSTLL